MEIREIEADKISYVICADLESLFKKIDGYGNNPKKTKKTKHFTKNSQTYSLQIFNVNYWYLLYRT